jgi:hypothetical protein
MHMIFFVLDDPDRLDDLLTRWEAIGIRGVTVIESTGMHRLRRRHVAFRYIFGAEQEEEGHLTLVTIVKDEATVQACLAATEALIGNLDDPNTGIFTAWPLSLVKGLPPESGEE